MCQQMANKANLLLQFLPTFFVSSHFLKGTAAKTGESLNFSPTTLHPSIIWRQKWQMFEQGPWANTFIFISRSRYIRSTPPPPTNMVVSKHLVNLFKRVRALLGTCCCRRRRICNKLSRDVMDIHEETFFWFKPSNTPITHLKIPQ